MNRYILKNSILTRFILFILLSLLVPFTILMTVTRTHIRKIEQNTASQYLSSNLDTVSASVDGILKNVEKFYVPLLLERDFTRCLRRLSPYASREEYPDFLDTHRIQDTLSRSAATNDYIYSIYAYSYPANRFFSSKINWNPDFNDYDTQHSDWLHAYESCDPQAGWFLIPSVEDGRPIFTSYRALKSDGELYGLISINIDAAVIAKQLGTIVSDTGSYCFMTSLDDQIVSASQQPVPEDPLYQTILDTFPGDEDRALFSVEYNGQNMFVLAHASEHTDFRYFIASPYRSINPVSSMLSELTLIYFVCILLLIFLLMSLSLLIFFRPIRQLFEGIQTVQAGDFGVRLPDSSTYEIQLINRQFNSMAESIQRLIRENYEQALLRKDAEIHNIQNQLNEHFLYNTLDSIRWTARMENAPQTSSMVYSLASFYRINLSSGKDFVRIEQIVEMLTAYLRIQEIRMRDQFSYSLSCPEAVYDKKVVKYLFQPIVENALVHGIGDSLRRLHLEIVFEVRDEDLVFFVRDDGVGISAQKQADILKDMADDTGGSIDHFALKMIHRQLAMEYGLTDTLWIHSELQNFCEIGFSIPLNKLGGTLL